MQYRKDSQTSLPVQVFRSQLRLVMNVAGDGPIKTERTGQEFIGKLLQKTAHEPVSYAYVDFNGFESASVIPEKKVLNGAAMYVHGGGYCCGDIEYAKGFGTVIAAACGVYTFCPAYRLAPEFSYPAALDDAMQAYEYLLGVYPAEKIVLCGESAGGGLIYSMCLTAKERGLPLPGGIVAISPWTDLTESGKSYSENAEVDPSMTEERLKSFAAGYAKDLKDPFVSPLFADLSGMPESLIFVGGDEVMRDDSVQMHKNLIDAGCSSTLTVAAGMWHGYVLYGMKERRSDMDMICDFIGRICR